MPQVSLIIEDSKNKQTEPASLPDNLEVVETNELDRNAMGGTELMKYGLHERLPKELLEKFQIIPTRVRDIEGFFCSAAPRLHALSCLHTLPEFFFTFFLL